MEFLVLTFLRFNLSDTGLEIEKIVKYNGVRRCEVPISPKQFMCPRIQSVKKTMENFCQVQLLQCGDFFHSKSKPKLKT